MQKETTVHFLTTNLKVRVQLTHIFHSQHINDYTCFALDTCE
jgi:hypothetical protein